MQPDELEEALSRPSSAAMKALADLGGDLLVLGAGGKMGPSLARMARRALDAGQRTDAGVLAVARFTRPAVRAALEADAVRTLQYDLLDPAAVRALPDAAGVAFLAGAKFGTKDNPARTWALNAIVPALVAERYRGVPTVVFSSGNIYPFLPIESGGATEDTPTDPVGEYAQSVRARERIFEYAADQAGTPVTTYRLNYASEPRYGVLVDIAQRVYHDSPVDVTTGHFNTIWQGDANAIALACFGITSTPPTILNVTGNEILSVRDTAIEFGRIFGRTPRFTGTESPTALLSNASRATELFGTPTVSTEQLMQWIAAWIVEQRPSLDAPTHFDVRDGDF